MGQHWKTNLVLKISNTKVGYAGRKARNSDRIQPKPFWVRVLKKKKRKEEEKKKVMFECYDSEWSLQLICQLGSLSLRAKQLYKFYLIFTQPQFCADLQLFLCPKHILPHAFSFEAQMSCNGVRHYCVTLQITRMLKKYQQKAKLVLLQKDRQQWQFFVMHKWDEAMLSSSLSLCAVLTTNISGSDFLVSLLPLIDGAPSQAVYCTLSCVFISSTSVIS